MTDTGLLDMSAYTIKGPRNNNKFVFVENYTNGEALKRIVVIAQDLAAYRKLGQISETAGFLRCTSIDYFKRSK